MELGSSLQLPNFSFLAPIPSLFPQPPPPAAGPNRGDRPEARGSGRGAPNPGRRQRSLETPRKGRGGAGRGWKRSQSADEAMAGPRLAGPAASNLRCPSRSFEPLHPLVALSLLQPPGPKRRPGPRTGVRRKKTQVPPSVRPAQSVR